MWTIFGIIVLPAEICKTVIKIIDLSWVFHERCNSGWIWGVGGREGYVVFFCFVFVLLLVERQVNESVA